MMKYTKKMVMVPESEYYALMNMLKGGIDPLEGEKSMIDSKIQKNLADTSADADVKAKRHSWLYKRRRQLRDLVENRPQKVVIEDPMAIPNIAPYMGIQKTKARLEEDNERVTPEASFNVSGFNNDTLVDYASANENGDDTDVRRKPLTFAHKTSPKNYAKLLHIIGKNPENYGIVRGTGQVLTNFNAPVAGSDYTQSLKYMTGRQESPPRGHRFFLQRLNNDPSIMKYFPDLQTGHGVKSVQGGQGGKKKLVWVKMKPIKTPGLEREKSKRKITSIKLPFKPLLWARL